MSDEPKIHLTLSQSSEHRVGNALDDICQTVLDCLTIPEQTHPDGRLNLVDTAKNVGAGLNRIADALERLARTQEASHVLRLKDREAGLKA